MRLFPRIHRSQNPSRQPSIFLIPELRRHFPIPNLKSKMGFREHRCTPFSLLGIGVGASLQDVAAREKI
jgi:hypothetical protein